MQTYTQLLSGTLRYSKGHESGVLVAQCTSIFQYTHLHCCNQYWLLTTQQGGNMFDSVHLSVSQSQSVSQSASLDLFSPTLRFLIE